MLLFCNISVVVWQRTAAPASRPLSVTDQKGKKHFTDILNFYVVNSKVCLSTFHLSNLTFINHLLPTTLQQHFAYPRILYMFNNNRKCALCIRAVENKCIMKERNMHHTHNAQLTPVLTEHVDSSGGLLCSCWSACDFGCAVSEIKSFHARLNYSQQTLQPSLSLSLK